MYERFGYEDFLREGIIRKMGEFEKEDWVKFHEQVWKDDIRAAEILVDESPRWSIIAAYYSMHNIAKLLIGKKGFKVTGKFVHAATVEAIRELVGEEYAETLEEGRRERAKVQYYSGLPPEFAKKRAKWFLEDVVKPFIESIRRMVEND